MTEEKSEKITTDLTSLEMMQVGGLLAGGGLLVLCYLLIRKSRNVLGWMLSVFMIAGGLNIFFTERQKRIVETGDRIRSQLDELDPITRAEVVKYLADQEAEKISGKQGR